MNASMLLSSLLARALLDALWLDALIALACALSFELLHGARPALRHALGMLAMIAMPVAPLAAALLRFAAGGHAMEFPMVQTMDAATHAEFLGPAMPGGPMDAESLRAWLAVCVAQCWLFGVVLMLSLQLRGWWQVRRLHTGDALVPEQWLHRFDVLRARLGIARAVGLRALPGNGSPFTAYARHYAPVAPMSHDANG